jgi:hypothetical protein
VLAAAQYLREVLSRVPGDPKGQLVYDGLLEVLEPARRVARQQRELAAARASVPVREQRLGSDRRTGNERRTRPLVPPGGAERRVGERRKGDRRRKA